MKNKINAEICGTDLVLVTEEEESYVRKVISDVDKRINGTFLKNQFSTKLEAAILVALDLCDEKNKLNDANDNLRAEIANYIDEINELMRDNEELRHIIMSRKNSGI